MSKTGSSALQVAFVRNRRLLAEHGVDYPEDPSDRLAVQDGVTSGNGLALSHYLVPWLSGGGRPARGDETPAQAAERRLDRFVTRLSRTGDATTVLYSSEFLYHFGEPALRRLVDRCFERQVRVEVVVYVRDIAGQAVSNYLQDVQRGLCTLTLHDYLSAGPGTRYRPAIRSRLRALRSVLGTSSVHVVRYDAVRRGLVEDFFSCFLGIPSEAVEDPVHREVNRSLTLAEAQLMRQVNQRVRDRAAAKEASDALVALPPLAAAGWFLTREEVGTLRDRFDKTVQWVNATGIRGGPLSLLGDLPVADVRHEEALDERHLRLTEWLAVLAQRASPHPS
jgi:hypothetical protein